MSSHNVTPEASSSLQVREQQFKYATSTPCSHLSQVLNSSARDTVLRNYNLAVRVSSFGRLSIFNMPSFKNANGKGKLDRSRIMKLKSKVGKCKDCQVSLGNTFMCLQCPHIGCSANHHFLQHAKLAGHIFGIDGHLGYMFCFKCGDYTNHPLLEATRQNILHHNSNIKSEDTTNDSTLIEKYSSAVSFKSTTGLRGFVNMGSTCFMSSILQTFIHNPLIREYFMTEGHMNCTKDANTCLTCCIDEIFTEFYTSNKTSGFGPVSLLNSAWKINKSLAGYSEQDAHEFWQFLVDRLHQDLNGTNGSSCLCIVHQTFSSDLQSSITCTQCGNVTTTIDPIIDISLGITQSDDLIGCLKNFTKTENLEIKYNCSKCHESTHATKRLLFSKFPNVLSIQLKRFEHNNTSTKLEKFIKFPFYLSMDQFSSSFELTQKHDPSLIFELFAIVCHIGSVNTGHYITVIKNNQGQWFKFDDSVVSLMSHQQVSELKAYLLFYIVHKLP